MMKRFTILLMTLLLTTLGAQAQDDDRQQTISGQVIDAELREPMVQASVQLFRQRDSTFVGGSVTDLRGNFSVESPGNGIFRIKISSVGFQPIEREVTLRRNQSQDLGMLMMSTDAVLLKEEECPGLAWKPASAPMPSLGYTWAFALSRSTYPLTEKSRVRSLEEWLMFREPVSLLIFLSPSWIIS